MPERGGISAASTVIGLLVIGSLPASARMVAVRKQAIVTPPALESVTIDHPLGKLYLRGWNRRTVKIMAIKRARDVKTAERMRIFTKLSRHKMHIRTRVRLTGPPEPDQKIKHQLRQVNAALHAINKRPKPWNEATKREVAELNRKLRKLGAPRVQVRPRGMVNRYRATPIAGARTELHVYVPYGTTVRGSTFRGNIDVARLRGSVTLESKLGKIYARDLNGAVVTQTSRGHQYLSRIRGAVDVSADDGNLSLKSVRGPRVAAKSVRGRIDARDLHTPLLRFSSTYGSITVQATLLRNGRFMIRTHKGPIVIRLPKRSGYHLHAETQHGRLKLPRGFKPMPGANARKRQGVHRSGGGRLQLISVFGNITVK